MGEAKYQRIKSMSNLKRLSQKVEDGLECFILLNFGARSSKQIWFNGKKFEVLHLIDGVYETYTERQLEKQTNIVKAMKCGSLWREL